MPAYLPVYPSPSAEWAPGIRGTPDPGRAVSQPQPWSVVKMPHCLHSPGSQGRLSYPAHTAWVQFDTPIVCLPFCSAQCLTRFLAAKCWEIPEKGTVNLCRVMMSSKPKISGLQVDVCTCTVKMMCSRCLWLKVHTEINCTSTAAPKNTPGTSDHPFLYCSCWQVSTNLLTLSAPCSYLTVQQPAGLPRSAM